MPSIRTPGFGEDDPAIVRIGVFSIDQLNSQGESVPDVQLASRNNAMTKVRMS